MFGKFKAHQAMSCAICGLMYQQADPNFGPLMTRIGFDAGMLAVYANNDPSAVQILPPLIIQEAEVEQVLGVLDGMLAKIEEMVA